MESTEVVPGPLTATARHDFRMKKLHVDGPERTGKSAQYLIDIVGEETALLMFERLGGLELSIPKIFNPERSKVAAQLANEIGETAARLLCNACGDTRLYVPRAMPGNGPRNAEIRAAYDAGESVDVLAKRHHLTVRHVRDILNCKGKS